MKITEVRGQEERTILTGMIVSRPILARITSKWVKEDKMFRSDWSNLVGQWCVDYFNKYERPPKQHVHDRFLRWSEKSQDKQTIQAVGTFLSSLSSDYKRLKKENNTDYVIDLASRHFNRIKLERLKEDIDDLLDKGEIDKATNKVEDFSKVEAGTGATIKVLTDKESVRKAFGEPLEPLIQYPGRMGQFLSPHLTRDAFIALQGPEGRGKSFWLLDFAFRGMEQRRKVAYFVLGDMSESQVQLRFGCRAAQIPINNKNLRVKYPIKLKRGPSDNKVSHKVRIYKRALTWQKAWKAYQRILHTKVRSKESYLRLQVHAADEISASGIYEQLKAWSMEGWVADVVIIDYADNLDLKAEGGDDVRNQTHRAWKKLRRISQKLHCLLITATQSNAASYEEDTIITRKNFSEDKRKLGQVTGMLGLNQFVSDKENDVYRLNWIKLREGAYSERRLCHVAGCLALANPAILSA